MPPIAVRALGGALIVAGGLIAAFVAAAGAAPSDAAIGSVAIIVFSGVMAVLAVAFVSSYCPGRPMPLLLGGLVVWALSLRMTGFGQDADPGTDLARDGAFVPLSTWAQLWKGSLTEALLFNSGALLAVVGAWLFVFGARLRAPPRA